MEATVHEYDAKLDSKRRLTLREAGYQYYHVQEMDDGVIMLFPRVLKAPEPNQDMMEPINDRKKDISKRIGIAKGLFKVPDEFYDWDQEIEEMFEGRI